MRLDLRPYAGPPCGSTLRGASDLIGACPTTIARASRGVGSSRTSPRPVHTPTVVPWPCSKGNNSKLSCVTPPVAWVAFVVSHVAPKCRRGQVFVLGFWRSTLGIVFCSLNRDTHFDNGFAVNSIPTKNGCKRQGGWVSGSEGV